MPFPVRLTILLPLLGALTACQRPGALPPAEDLQIDEFAEGVVTVAVANRQDLDGLLAEYAGKVVLIDYWATWCDPCLRQFPHTVQLHRFYGPDGLSVISVSLDNPENVDLVLEFLKGNKATFTNLLSVDGTSQKSFDQFEIEGGAIPYYQLFDRQGRLRYKTSGQPSGIEQRIERLLGESADPDANAS